MRDYIHRFVSCHLAVMERFFLASVALGGWDGVCDYFSVLYIHRIIMNLFFLYALNQLRRLAWILPYLEAKLS